MIVAIVIPGVNSSPSFSLGSKLIFLSTSSKTIRAISTPHRTPSSFGKIMPSVCDSGGTIESVVISPLPRSSFNAFLTIFLILFSKFLILPPF